ncbi:VWA domain-containing protein [Alkaliphilus oremlandii]|uniref:Magnesium chelatase n=1 Tax=Alkaliphilus oremlandii (strain OhILAs) TaxID=350688 RepID=A8MJ77_ALKOO|nr:VWA domain-containing protein [Alkaliphilus oremlandii]ABW19859.1 Magnesium chelatase [Alkaliphilus oremlandii OhILAs]
MESYRCFPFAAVCGQERVKKALILNVINPNIGGVLISGEKGTAKSTLVRGLANIIGDRAVINLPLNITEDRLVGSVDINKAIQYGRKELEEGILKKAHHQFLYIDEVNLLSAYIVNILLEVASTGVNIIEREGISYQHDSKFSLIGSMNPEEGTLGSQFIDRFGLYVETKGEEDLNIRLEIMKRRLAYEKNPEGFCKSWAVASKAVEMNIREATNLLNYVRITEADYQLASDIGKEGRCAGHRAEIILIEAARAIAAFNKRTYITQEDMKEASFYVLPHRMREQVSIEEVIEKNKASDSLAENRAEESHHQNHSGEIDSSADKPISNGDYDGDSEHGDSSAEGSVSSHTVEDIEAFGEDLSMDMVWQSRFAVKGSGKRNKVKTDSKEGRYIRYRIPKGRPKDIAFDATFRIAACSQGGRNREGLSLVIRSGDIREKVREKHTGATILFVVDASGSMGAKRRMGAVKGAVLSLLNDAYQKRDNVGIIAFRKDGADTLLNITRSVDLAQKCLTNLPTGGKTPLASGLYKAYELLKIDRIKNADALQYIVLVSDGKGNVPLFSENAIEDAYHVGEKIRNENIKSMVLDTENGYIQLGFAKKLAEKMDSAYIKMNHISSKEIEDNVKGFIRTV